MREPFKSVQVGLEYEDVILWLASVVGVREKRVVASSRSRKPSGKHIVGYSTLIPDSPNNGNAGCFNRRIFIEDANGVAPDTVFPGVSLDKPVSCGRVKV